MSEARLAALLSAYCQRHKLDGHEKLLQGAPLLLDGVAFVLKHSPETPALAHVYCDLGAIRASDKKQVYRHLLTANASIHFASGCSLMISPVTGHVLLAASFDIGSMHPERLEQMLSMLSTAAKNWQGRQADFPDGTEVEKGVSQKRRASAARHHFDIHLMQKQQ